MPDPTVIDVTAEEEDVVVDPLGRAEGENNRQHRGFLLWVAQDPLMRSYNLTAKALSCSDSTVRNWSKRHAWEERVEKAGTGAQAAAIGRYRNVYLRQKGPLELEVVRHAISLPLVPGEPVRVAASEHIRSGRIDMETGERKKGNPNGNPAGNKNRDDAKDAAKKTVVLIDAALATFARQLKDGEVKVRPRDVIVLANARRHFIQEIDHLEGNSPTSSGPVEVPESFRVRAARKSGGDIAEAMLEDAEELRVILMAVCRSGKPLHSGEERDRMSQG